MPVLYEVIELANGDIGLQREGDSKGYPLITMRFSTELLRFLRNNKLDIAKIMIEAGLEEVAKLAADFSEAAPVDSEKITSASELKDSSLDTEFMLEGTADSTEQKSTDVKNTDVKRKIEKLRDEVATPKFPKGLTDTQVSAKTKNIGNETGNESRMASDKRSSKPRALNIGARQKEMRSVTKVSPKKDRRKIHEEEFAEADVVSHLIH